MGRNVCAYCHLVLTFPEEQAAKTVVDGDTILYFHPGHFKELFKFAKYVFDKEVACWNIIYSDEIFLKEDFFALRKLIEGTIREILYKKRNSSLEKKAKMIWPFWRLAVGYLHFYPKIPEKLTEEIKKISPQMGSP